MTDHQTPIPSVTPTTKIETVVIPKDVECEGVGTIHAGTYRVEMPDHYDASEVDAADLANDPELRVVGEGPHVENIIVIVNEPYTWGVDVTSDDAETLNDHQEEWLDDNAPYPLTFHVRRPRSGQAAGVYRRESTGELQILDDEVLGVEGAFRLLRRYSIPVESIHDDLPDLLRRSTEAAWDAFGETGKGSDVTEMPAEKPARLTPAQRALLARLRDEYSANGGLPVGDFIDRFGQEDANRTMEALIKQAQIYTLDLDDFRKFRVIEKLEELGLVEYHPGKGWTPVEATR